MMVSWSGGFPNTSHQISLGIFYLDFYFFVEKDRFCRFVQANRADNLSALNLN